jgi:addiction module HigA family antidote
MPKVTVKDPGSVLKSFLEEYQLNPSKIAAAVGLSQSTIRQIILNKMKISVPAALRFAKLFGNPVEFWINIQLEYDIANAAKDAKLSAILKGIQKAKKPAPGKKAAAAKAGAKAGTKAARGKTTAKPGAAKKPKKSAAASKAAGTKAAKGKTTAKTGAAKKTRKSAATGKAKRPSLRPKSTK